MHVGGVANGRQAHDRKVSGAVVKHEIGRRPVVDPEVRKDGHVATVDAAPLPLLGAQIVGHSQREHLGRAHACTLTPPPAQRFNIENGNGERLQGEI